jgi:L-ascorbate metabolism protein UlaG (beta-lactamase superfamily)
MQISWHGLSCFEITNKVNNKEVTIITDPYQNTTGLRIPRTLESDIVLSSHDEEDSNNIAAVAGTPYLIDQPGEYEVKDIFVFGINAKLKRTEQNKPVKNMMFRIESEGMHLVHLGALDRILTDEELQRLQNVDILMIPVGGNRVMTPKVATEVISQIEPRVIIPMTHHTANVKEDLMNVSEFCKDLPETDMLIVTLNR